MKTKLLAVKVSTGQTRFTCICIWNWIFDVSDLLLTLWFVVSTSVFLQASKQLATKTKLDSAPLSAQIVLCYMCCSFIPPCIRRHIRRFQYVCDQYLKKLHHIWMRNLTWKPSLHHECWMSHCPLSAGQTQHWKMIPGRKINANWMLQVWKSARTGFYQ